MKKAQLIVAGIGPGSPEDITPAVIQAVKNSDVVIGYKYYFQFIEPYLEPGTECIDTGMKREKARAEQAFELAEQGKTVCVISSGDAGIYGMAPLVYEMKRERGSRVEIEVLPGISAFQKAASLLGAPIGHDFCVISLSDLLTPWAVIERRIRCGVQGDFVVAIYNPSSRKRADYLRKAADIMLAAGAEPNRACGYVENIGREGTRAVTCTLAELREAKVNMFTTVYVGNSRSFIRGGKLITPRGYEL